MQRLKLGVNTYPLRDSGFIFCFSRKDICRQMGQNEIKQGRNNGGFAATNRLAIAGKIVLKVSRV